MQFGRLVPLRIGDVDAFAWLWNPRHVDLEVPSPDSARITDCFRRLRLTVANDVWQAIEPRPVLAPAVRDDSELEQLIAPSDVSRLPPCSVMPRVDHDRAW